MVYLGLALIAATTLHVASAATTPPTVSILDGTVIGSAAFEIENFKGIPYAKPPTGDRRLKPAQSLDSSFGTLTATATPTACPQLNSKLDTSLLPAELVKTLGGAIAEPATIVGEDCLTLNVQRPAGTNNTSKLPVLLWIYGGGFQLGSTQGYDATKILLESVALKSPILYVAINYRVGGFGFLAGEALAREGSTNLGLRDQRLALEWVANNIEAFGGDPDKVTLWGESAGSISVFDHTIINHGDNTYNGKPLFRGAIMDSGSTSPADPVTAPQAQHIFEMVVEKAGCQNNSAVLSCLRALPFEQYHAAANSVPALLGYRSLDLSYFPRPDPGSDFYPVSPEVALERGLFAKVPVIIGDQEDEGTIFSLAQSNITTDAQLIEYLASWFPGNPNATDTVADLLENYPNEPQLGQPAGSPFNTTQTNNIYPQYKRLAAIIGDLTFTLTRRSYLSVISQSVRSWSYLSTYLHALPVLGTFHTSDVLVAFGAQNESSFSSQAVQKYYISFVSHLCPNALGAAAQPGLIEWPLWDNCTGKPEMLNISAGETGLMLDTFREGAWRYLRENPSAFRQ